MKNLYRFIFAIGLLTVLTNSFALPPCQGSDASKWNNCYGIWKSENSDKYVGEFKDGTRNGQGTYIWTNGQKYVGEWKGGNQNGRGILYLAGGSVSQSGIWSDGKIVASQYFDANSLAVLARILQETSASEEELIERRRGQSKLPPCPSNGFLNNCFGTYVYNRNYKYVGEWYQDKHHGQGVATFADANNYVGDWDNGNRTGQGTSTWPTGEKYVGEFMDGKRNGRGIEYRPDGSVYQSGIWNDGKLATSQTIDPNSFTRIAKGNSDPSAAEAQRLENERKAAQLEEERKRIEEEKRQIALERQRTESQKAQTQVAPDNRRRLALVIGNDNYSSLPRLNNAVNDAKSISDALRQANFEVMSYNNLDKRRMQEALRSFTGKLGRDDVGLFYFSGHGIQADNRNFLIPVGESVKKSSDVPYDGIDVNWVMDNLKDARNAVNIVVLDACRSSLPDVRGGMSRGLTVTEAPQGSIVAYATSPGKAASDGDGGNSPFTKNLIRVMQRKGMKIEDAFKEVRQSVIRETNGEQVPQEVSQLIGDFYFRP